VPGAVNLLLRQQSAGESGLLENGMRGVCQAIVVGVYRRAANR
jgi:hypothetical protein